MCGFTAVLSLVVTLRPASLGYMRQKKKPTNPAKKYHEQWNSKDILRVSLCAFLKTISKLFYVNGFAPLKKIKQQDVLRRSTTSCLP